MGRDAQGMGQMLGTRVDMNASLPKIPFFLSMDSCPRRCVYCHQGEITGIAEVPSPDSVQETLSRLQSPHEVCYFGGSFTCFPKERRNAYMNVVFSAPEESCVRFSTHPCCISSCVLDSLAPYPVSMIELGISSLDDDVLNRCNRGYTGDFALSAMASILGRGFSLGAQLMIGLPGQTEESSLHDLRRIAALRAKGESFPITLRIYPCLVLDKTPLAERMKRGEYTPLTLEEGILRAGRLLFEANRLGLAVQRIGLQETESLARNVLAGPHHPALGEMARSVAFVASLLEDSPEGPWEIEMQRISLLKGHDKFGLRQIARTTGLPLELVENRIGYRKS